MKNSQADVGLLSSWKNNFFRPWKVFFRLSLVVMGIAVAVLLVNAFRFRSPLNLGIDFTGGVSLQYRVKQKVTTGQIEQFLKDLLKKTPGVQISPQADQSYVVLLRTEPISDEEIGKIEERLREKIGEIESLGSERLSPAFGKELLIGSLIAIVLAFVLLLIYLGFRFNLPFGLGAVAALVHDALITIGAFSLLQREVNLPFLGAILTILGYSLNDTVVIFDRVRENQKIYRGMPAEEVMRISIAQTLGRTVNTVLSTLFPILSILIFGGITLQSFALALAIGVISGTYSTWFIACPVALLIEGVKLGEKVYVPPEAREEIKVPSGSSRGTVQLDSSLSKEAVVSSEKSQEKRKEKKGKKKKPRRR
ncbi:MAG: protein translocase subunit SecF [bacterium JZ-2024 1]